MVEYEFFYRLHIISILAFVSIMIHTTMLHGALESSLKSLVSLSTFVNPLIGSKLYDVTARSALDCQSACLSVNLCTMMTFNTGSQMCTLYTIGSTSYTVTDQVLFVESKQSGFPPYSTQGQCLTSTTLARSPQYCCQGYKGFTGIACQQLLLSFQATRSSSFVSSGIVPFDNVSVNHWSFNQASNTFTAPVSGYYWLHMSVGIPANTVANVLLQGLGVYDYVNVSKSVTSFDGFITTSANAVVYLTSGSAVSMSSQYPLYSDKLLQTSFGGFLIDSVMSPVVAFAVGLTRPFVCSTACSIAIPFDVVSFDTLAGWNSKLSQYTVAVTGTYVIALTAGNTNLMQGKIGAYLQVNSAVKMYHVYTYDIFHPDDTYSGLGLVSLSAGDVITEVLYLGSISSASVFSGFLYSPYLTPAVAFSVGVNLLNSLAYAPLDPVPYDTVLVNQGNGWNKNTFRFTAPVGGVYYIHVTSMMAGYNVCQKDVLLNGKTVVNYMYNSTQQTAEDSRSRGFIVRLKAGDELRVRLTTGLYYVANNLLNHFAGFLIHF